MNIHHCILVTGGAGFIGSNFVNAWIKQGLGQVVNIDKLTYAGNLDNISQVLDNQSHHFLQVDIADREAIGEILNDYQPTAIVNFAAESHVDRSIHAPDEFIQTNIVGTFHLLEEVRLYWSELTDSAKYDFRFLHVSTDEVYGSLAAEDAAFKETNAYKPNSPYSASKAASDHLIRAYYQTYGMPMLTTNCSNNYGPYQLPEKLIPLVIYNALNERDLPIYGNGSNVRDWLYVEDHCSAVRRVLEAGDIGETYNIGGWNEKTNIAVVYSLCDILDKLRPKSLGSYRDQVIYVQDRLGHDQRYAIDATKIERELGWKPRETFDTGLKKTVQWYLEHQDWLEHALNKH